MSVEDSANALRKQIVGPGVIDPICQFGILQTTN